MAKQYIGKLYAGRKGRLYVERDQQIVNPDSGLSTNWIGVLILLVVLTATHYVLRLFINDCGGETFEQTYTGPTSLGQYLAYTVNAVAHVAYFAREFRRSWSIQRGTYASKA